MDHLDLKEMDDYLINFNISVDEFFKRLDNKQISIKGKNIIRVPSDPDQVNKIKNIFRFYSGILQSNNRAYIGAYITQGEALLKTLEKEKE